MTHFKHREQRAARVALVVSALGLALVAGACSEGRASSLDVVRVVARDFAFEVKNAGAIRPGPVELELRNEGRESHQLSLAKLKQGATSARFTALLTGAEPGNPLELVEFVGGPNHVAPGKTEVSYVELEAGEYVMVCFIPSHDGAPHLVKGMTGSFRVEGDASDAELPAADETVKLTDYGITMPDSIDGDAVLRVENAGREAHELALLELPEGMTAEAALAQLVKDHEEGNKPTTAMPVAGGAAVVSHGETTLARVNLAKGRYFAVCYAPDAQGKPHFALGMTKEFTVR